MAKNLMFMSQATRDAIAESIRTGSTVDLKVDVEADGSSNWNELYHACGSYDDSGGDEYTVFYGRASLLWAVRLVSDREGRVVTSAVWYAEARDTTTGCLRECGPERISPEDAESDAEELRAKWALGTKVRIIMDITEETPPAGRLK